MNDTALMDMMTELGALRRGHFLLSSGRHSDTYFQCALVLQYPDLALDLGRRLAARCDAARIDVVVSPALGALLLGHEVARALGRRFVFTERKEGAMSLRRDFTLEKGDKALIVEDVVTRGTSTREVADIVTAAGGIVVGAAALVDRTTADVALPVPVASLLKVDVVTWPADDCPLCRQGLPVVKPGSRGTA